MLADGALRLRLCIGPNAFGNALGNSIACGDWSASQQESELTGVLRSEIEAMNAGAQTVRPLLLADSGQFMTDVGSPVYPNLVTDERVMAADGTSGLRGTDAVRTAYADALNQVRAMDVKRIFDQTDPHQYMIFVVDDGTHNDANSLASLLLRHHSNA